jgi:hypothetical protein
MSIPLSKITLKMLTDLGYNICRSFDSSIAPLQILDRSSQANVFEIIGEAQDIFYKPVKLPDVKRNSTVDMGGTSTSNLSVSLTASFLEDFLKDSILGKATINAAYTNASTFISKFSNCSSDVIYLIKTWNFLKNSSQGGINESEFVTSRILDNTSLYNPAYIVTETLQAQDISLIAKDEYGVTITPSLEALKALKIDGKFEYKVTEEGNLSIKSITPMVFAFKACCIWVNHQTISIALPSLIPGDNYGVPIADIPNGYAFAESSSLNNPEILTPVLLSRSGMPIRIQHSR